MKMTMIPLDLALLFINMYSLYLVMQAIKMILLSTHPGFRMHVIKKELKTVVLGLFLITFVALSCAISESIRLIHYYFY
jgi:hypothetical protein